VPTGRKDKRRGGARKDSKAYRIVQSTKVMRIVLCKAQRRSVECSFCEALRSFLCPEAILVEALVFQK